MGYSLKENAVWFGGMTAGGLLLFFKSEEDDYAKLIAGQEALAYNVLRVAPNTPSTYLPKVLGTDEPSIMRGSQFVWLFRLDEKHSLRLDDSVKESLSDIRTANAAEAKKILETP